MAILEEDSKMETIFWLFPIIFMLHEIEEIIGFRLWLCNNSTIVEKYKRLSSLSQNFSNEGFALAVLEEYILCVIITGISIFLKVYLVWIGAFIAFSLHLLIHIIQSVIIKKYIPALISSIVLLPISIFLISRVILAFGYTAFQIVISSVACIIIMVLNLFFVHKIMQKVSETLKNR